MDAGWIEGFVTGFSTGALVVGLLLRDRRLERPGHSYGPLASNQDPAYLEAQYQAYRQAAQQPPSNVVSPKGWSNEGWRAWEVTPPPSEREVEIRRGNGPITRIIPCQQNPAWNIANVYWRGVSKEG